MFHLSATRAKVTYTTSKAAYFLSVAPYGQAVKNLKTHQKSLKKK